MDQDTYASPEVMSSKSGKKQGDNLPLFRKVLKQLKFDGIRSVAASVRRAKQFNDNTSNQAHSSTSTTPPIDCKVEKEPRWGSYNLVYHIRFEDGIQWMLKIPANGHQGAWDTLASESLTSEALTVLLIGQNPSIPVPAIHHFDATMDNEIGCPYILMDFIEGKPLHQVWFCNGVSVSRREQVRLRSLHTIAVAMSALSELQFERSGSLRFDSDGNFIDTGNAKACDYHTMLDRYGNIGDDSEDDIYRAKAPTEDMLSSLLSVLNDRRTKSSDKALDRGVRECIRMFTGWALDYTKLEEQKFTLAHPDFDFQNLLVKDDGTLCGIIDWDGVAAVPHSVGSLKYPLWLMRDWDPACYSYNPKTRGPKWSNGRRVNCPDEMDKYRGIYSQFIEAALLAPIKESLRSKRAADITRSSLLLGSLEIAIKNPGSSDKIIKNIFQVMEWADHASRAESSDPKAGDEDEDGDEREDCVDDGSSDDDSSSDSDDYDGDIEKSFFSDDSLVESIADAAHESEKTINCPRCRAENEKESAGQKPIPAKVASYLGGSHEPPSQSSKVSAQPMPLHNEETSEPVILQSTIDSSRMRTSIKTAESKKARLCRFICTVGEKGCRGLARKLHRKGVPGEPTEELPITEPLRSNCKRAGSDSEARKVDGKPSGGIHQGFSQDQDPVRSKGTAEQNWVKAFFRRVLAVLKKAAHLAFAGNSEVSAVENDLEAQETSAQSKPVSESGVLTEPKVETKEVLPSEIQLTSPILYTMEHAEHCPRASKTAEGTALNSNTDQVAETEFEEVWARLGLELRNAGISAAMLKTDKVTIADWIITTQREKHKRLDEEEEMEEMRKEAEAEEEKRKRRKARKAEKKAMKEILVGLGKDELGERRLWRLQRRFKKLLDVMLGLK